MPRGSDDPLVAGLVAGREEALAAAYEQFAARLLAAAWGMLGSREEAEDAVQEVFLNLVRSRSSLADVESLQGYLFTAIRHAAVRRWQRRRRERASADLVAAGNVAASDPRRAEPSGRLERALRALPAEQREVVALKIDGGLTFAETAAVLGISINTVASRYRYALEKLRQRLGEERT
jgi:RNA polymerase sigma-70 factor (ECF subfamily)